MVGVERHRGTKRPVSLSLSPLLSPFSALTRTSLIRMISIFSRMVVLARADAELAMVAEPLSGANDGLQGRFFSYEVYRANGEVIKY